jgi:hypothetical protein
MKNICLICLNLFIAFVSKADVITVNNATVSPGQFSSIASAISAAKAGDTILIHGTGINYGGFTVDKRLVFIGAGHNPVDKQNSNPSTVDNITLTTGSGQSGFYGLNMNYMVTNTSISDIVISNCMIRNRVQIRHHGSNNWVIDGCVFSSSDKNVEGDGVSVSNMRMRNSVFNGYFWNLGGGANYNYFINCIFLSNVNHNTFQYCNPFYVRNCIFYRAVPRQNNGWVSFDKCLSFQTVGGNNAFSPNNDASPRTMFEGIDPQFESFPSAGAYFDYSHDYRLKALSPVKGLGTDATDLGVFGGTEFSNVLLGYNQNGIPLNPYIKSFNITGATSVNAGESLQISVEAKVRNN